MSQPDRAGYPAAENVVAGVVQAHFTAQDDFLPLSLRYAIASDVLAALRSLPVAQRMEAMGMRRSYGMHTEACDNYETCPGCYDQFEEADRD